jgi:GntR family transcriptional repressor for pyruvate dehydrogenase complex
VIDRRNTYAKVADDIVSMLKSGELTPGSTMMSERELTEAYGIGRSSAREALRVLEAKGLIVPDERGSFLIANPVTALNGSIELLFDIHSGTLRDLYEVRRMLEVENAALAAARRTDAQLSAMAQAITEEEAASNAHEAGKATVEAIMEADVRFHMVIAEASHNPLALTLMEGITGILRNAQLAIGDIAGLVVASLREHRIIYQAIETGAVQSARVAMLEHLQHVEHDAEPMLGRAALSLQSGPGS